MEHKEHSVKEVVDKIESGRKFCSQSVPKLSYKVTAKDIVTVRPTFDDMLSVLKDIYNRKNADYGNSFDKSLDEFGLVASVVRMSDKMERIKSLTNKEAEVKDESIEDTLIDLANYAIMTVLWMKK